MGPKEKSKGKKKAKGPKRRRPTQPQMPGMEDKKDPVIARLAAKYVPIRDERMQLTKQEVEARDAILLKMRERGMEVYRDKEVGIEITIVHGKDKVKVKSLKDDEEEEIDWEPEGPAPTREEETQEPPAENGAAEPPPSGEAGG